MACQPINRNNGVIQPSFMVSAAYLRNISALPLSAATNNARHHNVSVPMAAPFCLFFFALHQPVTQPGANGYLQYVINSSLQQPSLTRMLPIIRRLTHRIYRVSCIISTSWRNNVA